jgi:hypothetical protein
MAQHVVNPPVVGDTYTDSQNLYTNYALSPNLYVANYYDNPYTIMDSYIRLNLSAVIPVRKKVISAYLSLYKNATTPYIMQLRVHKTNDNVAITDITAAHSPDGQAYNNYDATEIPTAIGVLQAFATKAVIDAYGAGANTIKLSFGPQYNATLSLNSNEAASNRPSLSVTYEDVPPDAPTPLEPIGLYKDSNSPIRLSWQYNSSVGGTQKAFDLQWSTDGSSWTTISQTIGNNYYDAPAGAFLPGNIYWRVRCYNEYDEVGPYSANSAFYAIGAPIAPSILPVQSNSARPIIEWTAAGQQIYQVQVSQDDTIIYDSGNVPGILTRNQKVKTFLPDGEYLARVRIKNEYDIWSAWGEATFSVATLKPEKPELMLLNTAYGIRAIVTEYKPKADSMLLYRDGKCIASNSSPATKRNLVRNGNCEEGILWWEPFLPTVTLSIENNKFKLVTTTEAIGYGQKIKVKPNTDYYASGNISGSSGRITIFKNDYSAVIKAGTGSFNSGNNAEIIYYIQNTATSATSYFDSLMLVEGTTAPAAYESYARVYTFDDNAVINGRTYNYFARGVHKVEQRQITNILGMAGDCEDVNLWGIISSGVVTDTSIMKYGSKSIKHSIVNAYGVIDQILTLTASKYYLWHCSCYIQSLASGSVVVAVRNVDFSATVQSEFDYQTLNQWQTKQIRFTGKTDTRIEAGCIDLAAGVYNLDGGMLVELSQAEYYDLTDAELLVKYPFGNNTFTGLEYEAYIDSDTASGQSNIQYALIAPVSKLTDVFVFNRSLNGPPKRTYDRNPNIESVYYSGRTYPVSEPTEHISAGLSLQFFLKTYADVERFVTLYDRKEPVLYRDARGRKMYGSLSELSVNEELFGYVVSFTVTQIDYTEELEV